MKTSEKHEQALLYSINYLKQLPYVKEIWLYGSYARKNFKFTSDVDLYVVIDEKFDAPKNKRLIKNEAISEDYKLPEVDIHFGVKRINSYIKKTDYFDVSEYLFINNIKKDGVLLWQI